METTCVHGGVPSGFQSSSGRFNNGSSIRRFHPSSERIHLDARGPGYYYTPSRFDAPKLVSKITSKVSGGGFMTDARVLTTGNTEYGPHLGPGSYEAPSCFPDIPSSMHGTKGLATARLPLRISNPSPAFLSSGRNQNYTADGTTITTEGRGRSTGCGEQLGPGTYSASMAASGQLVRPLSKWANRPKHGCAITGALLEALSVSSGQLNAGGSVWDRDEGGAMSLLPVSVLRSSRGMVSRTAPSATSAISELGPEDRQKLERIGLQKAGWSARAYGSYKRRDGGSPYNTWNQEGGRPRQGLGRVTTPLKRGHNERGVAPHKNSRRVEREMMLSSMAHQKAVAEVRALPAYYD